MLESLLSRQVSSFHRSRTNAKRARRGRKLSGPRLVIETLEDRRVLAFENAQVLSGGNMFERNGAIQWNEVDSFRVESPAGGRINVDAIAADLQFSMAPYLRAVSTSAGYRWYTNFGFPNYTEIQLDPPLHTNPFYQLEWDERDDSGTVADTTQIEITGATAMAQAFGELTLPADNPRRVEWSMSASTSGEIISPGVPFVRYMSIDVRPIVAGGVSYYNSNYSGDVLTSVSAENPGHIDIYEGAYFDGSFPDGADLDLTESRASEHYWEFVPHEFIPHIAVFDANGVMLGDFSTTGHLDVLTPVSGYYYVAIARTSEFLPDEFIEEPEYRLPYHITIETQPDIVVEQVVANVEESQVEITTTFDAAPVDGSTEGLPNISAYWSANAEGTGVLQEIDSWKAYPGVHTQTIRSSRLSNAPPWATHVVVIADKESELVEASEDNNRQGILVVQEPTIEFVVGNGGYSAEPSNRPSYMKSSFSVWVRIQNNSLIPHVFDSSVAQRLHGTMLLGHESEGGLGFPDGYYPDLVPHNYAMDDLLLPELIELDGLSKSDYVPLADYILRWDWLPVPVELAFPSTGEMLIEPWEPYIGVYNLLTQTLAEFLAEEDVSLLDAIDSIDALGGFTEWKIWKSDAWQKFSDAAGALDDLVTVYETLTEENPQFPSVVLELTTNVARDAPAKVYTETLHEFVYVPPLRRQLYDAAQVSLSAAKIAFSKIFEQRRHPYLMILKAAVALGAAELAYDMYRRAQDPPDADFTSRVTFAGPAAGPWQDVPDERLVDYTRSLLEIQSYSDTARRAHDKADGAALAANTFWEAEQLIDAAHFDSLAVRGATPAIALATLLAPYFAASESTPAETIEDLQTEGVPAELVTILQDAGMTSGEIDAMVSSLTEESLAAPYSEAETTRLEAAAKAASAVDTLRRGIELRVASGATVSAISDEQELELWQLRSALDSRIETHASPFEAIALTEEYLDTVTEMIVSTNNWFALWPDIEFGYRALLHLQFNLDAGPTALDAALDALEAAGSDAEAIAALRAHAAEISMHAATGQFALMAAAIETAAGEVIEGWATSLPSEAAYRVYGQLMTMRSVAVAGVATSAVSPPTHDDHFTVIAGTDVRVAPRSALGMKGALFRPIVATQGSIQIVDEAGDPLVHYSPSPDAEGPERISYVAIDPATWQFHTSYAYGTVVAGLGFGENVNQASLDAGAKKRYGFSATQGQILEINLLHADNYASVVLLDADTGEELVFEMLDTVRQITIERNGLFVLEVTAFDGPVTYAFAAEVSDIVTIPIDTGQRITETIAAGEQRMYAFTLTEFASTAFLYWDDLTDEVGSWWNREVEILGPEGLLYEGFGGTDSGVLWPQFTGEFRVLVRNSGGSPFEFDFRILSHAQAGTFALDEDVVATLSPYAAELFVLSNAPGGPVAVHDLGSDPFTGDWALDAPPSVRFGASLGFDGLALTRASASNVLTLSSRVDFDANASLRLEPAEAIELVGVAGEPIEATIASPSVARFEFTAQADEVWMLDSLAEDTSSEWVAVYVEAPDGTLEFLGSPAYDSDPFVIRQSGVHRLLLLNSTEEVATRFSLLNLNAAPRITSSTGTIAGEFAAGVETHVYRFDVAASGSIELTLTGVEDSVGYWQIHGVGDWYVDDDYWDASSEPRDISISTGGTYFLVIYSWSGAGSAYELSIDGVASTPEPMEGDLNGDGKVNLVDLVILHSNLGTTGGATRGMGDLDGDGNVNRADLARLVSAFGRFASSAPSPAAAAPVIAVVASRRAAEQPQAAREIEVAASADSTDASSAVNPLFVRRRVAVAGDGANRRAAPRRALQSSRAVDLAISLGESNEFGDVRRKLRRTTGSRR